MEADYEREKLGIDICETIIWTLSSFLENYSNPKHRTDFTIDDFSSYKWWETLSLEKEETYAEFSRYIEDHINQEQLKNRPGEWLDYIHFDLRNRMIPNAENAIELLAHNYELWGITDRNPELNPETFELSSMLWFDSLEEAGFDGLAIPLDRIYYTQKEKKSKSQILYEFGIKKMVDDDPEVVLSCARKGIEMFVLQRPWNKNLHRHPLIHGVNDWRTACSILLRRKAKFIPYT